jgi:hypothetical protein
MSEEETDEQIAESERAIAELHGELERIGVDMRLVSEAFRQAYSEYFGQEASNDSIFGLDAFSALERIRTLPAGAGTDAFLKALGMRNPPSL